jgi:hypothetical protein
MGAVRDGGRLGRNGLRGVVAALVVAVLPASAVGAGPADVQPVIEDGGSGSTVCINVITFRYYLCVRADGSIYRIYY